MSRYLNESKTRMQFPQTTENRQLTQDAHTPSGTGGDHSLRGLPISQCYGPPDALISTCMSQ